MIKKYIPDAITSMNLLCGVIGVVFAFKGRPDLAFIFMLAAAAADFLDGLAARALDAYSDMGKELDSLSDLISFGVLPSVMLYKLSCTCMFGESWVCWTPLLIALASGLRLAKFNTDSRQQDGAFLGIPTTACGMLCGSFCYYVAAEPASFLADWCAGPVFIPLFSACICWLLLCEMPVFSLKFHKDDPQVLKNKRIALAVTVLAVILVVAFFRLDWSLLVLLTLTLFVLKNIVYAVFRI